MLTVPNDVPSETNDPEIVWTVHPAGESRKFVVSGAVAEFLAATMHPAFLREDLPVPRRAVVQELVDQGEILGGMSTGYEWTPFEVTEEVYAAVCPELVASGLATPGVDPAWVDSLFFRRAERLAAERGTDTHHEVRRMTVMGESAQIRSRFPHLHEEVVTALRNRSEHANRYEFGSLDPFCPPPDQ